MLSTYWRAEWVCRCLRVCALSIWKHFKNESHLHVHHAIHSAGVLRPPIKTSVWLPPKTCYSPDVYGAVTIHPITAHLSIPPSLRIFSTRREQRTKASWRSPVSLSLNQALSPSHTLWHLVRRMLYRCWEMRIWLYPIFLSLMRGCYTRLSFSSGSQTYIVKMNINLRKSEV